MKKRKGKAEEDYFGENDGALRKDGWPSNVPVLIDDDMTWNFTTQTGKRDLQEWLAQTFNPNYPYDDTGNYRKAYKLLCVVITERFGKTVTVLSLFLEYAKRKQISLEWQAACWNEMLSRLEYEIPKGSRKDPGLNLE